MTQLSKQVLILGASGRFGRHTAEAFWNAGWAVTWFNRETDDLMEAARGKDVIVNAWNPPYQHWKRDLPDLTQAVIAAAKSSGATVLLPGNVYVYGADAPPLLSASTPHRAQNPLGRLRIEMEAAYRDAGVPTILLRAGDFLDTEASGNWFDRVIAKSLRRGTLTWPGRPDIPHAWAYLPDLARAAVQLAETREVLPRFAEVLFPGHSLSGVEIAALSENVTGRDIRLRRMAWGPLYLAAFVAPMVRGLIEMRYLWTMPHAIDPTALETYLPDFKPTPAREVVASALKPNIDPDEPVSAGLGHRFA